MMGFFKNNISIKIVSFMIALLLWFVALNTNNPYTLREINVPLRIENENTLADKNLELKDMNYKKSVNISIWGRKDIVDKVSPDDLQVKLDFAKVMSADDKTLQVEGPVFSNKDIEIKLVSPMYIDIQLERIERSTLPVQVVFTGTPKDSYKIVAVTKTPENITIENMASLIGSADSIRAMVDITGLDKDLVIKKECKVYDKNGQEIAALSKNLSVDIKIDVAREVPVTLITEGNLPINYIETSRQYTPVKVLVDGPYDIVSKLTELKTGILSINNITANISKTVPLKLPTGAKLINTPEEVHVSILVEKLAEKVFLINKGNILYMNPDEQFSYEVQEQQVKVTVSGRQQDIDLLDPTKIFPAADVNGLGEGTHRIILEVTLPSGLTQAGQVTADIKINKKVP